MTSLRVDRDQVEQALTIFVEPDQLTEIRLLGDRVWSAHWWGRDAASAAAATAELVDRDVSITGAYFIPNPIQPGVKWKVGEFRPLSKGAGTRDADISCRRWLLVDLDPIRTAGTMADIFQRQAAEALMVEVLDTLKPLWPEGGVLADSGNGVHCLLPLAKWPPQDNGMCRYLLGLLARTHDTDVVKVDTSVANPSRIVKLYGTPVRKGPYLPDRPWRLSRLYPQAHRS